MKTQTLLAAVITVSFTLPAVAADWPQWRGPNRDGISAETGLLKTWPSKTGPKLLWTYRDAGIGYSGPSIVGDRLYLMGCRDMTEYVIAIEVKSGKQAWEAKVGPRFDNGWGDGPRSNPTVDGQFVYALGGQGNLVCVAAADGSEKWRLNVQKDLKGQMMSGWGYCESVLIDGEKLVCSPGGTGGTFAALDKTTGKVIWRSTGLTEPAAYSSIVIASIGGVKQYVNMTGKGVAAVAAADGKLLWKNKQSANGTAVIPTPIVRQNQVYVSSGYGAGCGLLQLSLDGDNFNVTNVYSSPDMENQHGGVVLIGTHVYGYSDRGGWTCQELQTGKVVWNNKNLPKGTRPFPKGSVTFADGHLYCYSENDGTIALVKASPEPWKEDGRFQLPENTKLKRKSGKVWTHPVISNGHLYLRDQDLLFCFDVRGK